MKLASYVGTRDGFMGIGNRLIRLRLSGFREAVKTSPSMTQDILRSSHSEIVFEPGDGVDHLMPDGTCQPNDKGELWCVSSVGLERIPEYSPRRAGKLGGVRFKRINPHNNHWELDEVFGSALYAATWAHKNQGMLYDWQLVIGFLAWFIPHKADRVMCSEACAAMLAILDAHRCDPCQLQALVKRLHYVFSKS